MFRSVSLVFALSGCGAGAISLDSGEDDGTPTCGAGLWGETFRSLEDQECGLGPDGPVLCRWTLSFGDETYDWSYSDVAESGTVTCVDNELVGTSSGGAARQGTFQRPTARVRWEGQSYEQATE